MDIEAAEHGLAVDNPVFAPVAQVFASTSGDTDNGKTMTLRTLHIEGVEIFGDKRVGDLAREVKAENLVAIERH